MTRPLLILGFVYLVVAGYFAFYYPPVYLGAAGSFGIILIIIDMEVNKLKMRLKALEADSAPPETEEI